MMLKCRHDTHSPMPSPFLLCNHILYFSLSLPFPMHLTLFSHSFIHTHTHIKYKWTTQLYFEVLIDSGSNNGILPDPVPTRSMIPSTALRYLVFVLSNTPDGALTDDCHEPIFTKVLYAFLTFLFCLSMAESSPSKPYNSSQLEY